MKETQKKFPVCFQTWSNGGLQRSSLYWSNVNTYSQDHDDFAHMQKNHENYRAEGNSIANLVVCNNQEELNKFN